MKVKRILATVLATVMITGSLPLGGQDVYAMENSAVVETVSDQPDVIAEEPAGSDTATIEADEFVQSGSTVDATEPAEGNEGGTADDAAVDESAGKSTDAVADENADAPAIDESTPGENTEDGLLDETSVDDELSEENGDELFLEDNCSPYKVSGVGMFDTESYGYIVSPSFSYTRPRNVGRIISVYDDEKEDMDYYVGQYEENGKTVVCDWISVDVSINGSMDHHIVSVSATIGGKEALVSEVGPANLYYNGGDNPERAFWDFRGTRYEIRQMDRENISGDVVISVEVEENKYTVNSIGKFKKDETEITISPNNYDYDNGVRDERNSGICKTYIQDEDDNSKTNKVYYVNSEATALCVGINSGDKYIDPSSVKAKIGDKDAKVEQVYKGSEARRSFKIRNDDGSPIDGNVTILTDQISFLPVRTVSFVTEGDQTVSPLCRVEAAGSKENAYKCTNSKEGNTIKIGNLPDDEAASFKLYPMEHYKIESVKIGENVLTPDDNGLYTVDATMTGNQTVTVSVVPDGTQYEIPVSNKYLTVNWGNSASDCDKEASDNKIKTDYNKDVFLKVTGAKSIDIGEVMLTVNGQDPETLKELSEVSNEKSKVYQIYKADSQQDNNFRIPTGSAVTISSIGMAKIFATITNNDEPASDKLTFTGGKNAISGEGMAYCEGADGAVTLSCTIPEDRELDSAEAEIGETTLKDSELNPDQSGRTYKWTISGEMVAQAREEGKEIRFTIATKTKQVSIRFNEKLDSHKGVSSVEEYQKGEGRCSAINSANELKVPYGREAYIFVEVNNDSVIKTVKAGNTTLKSATEYITDEIENTELRKYYIIPAGVLKTDTEITVITEERNYIDLCDDGHCTVSFNVSGIVQEGDYYKLPATTKKVTYTIETKGNYKVTELYTQTKDSKKDIDIPEPTVNKTKDGLLYSITDNIEDYKNKQLRIKTDEFKRILEIPTGNLKSVSVRENGVAVTGTDSDPAEYEIADPFATVVITAEAPDGYKLTGKAKINNEKDVSAAKGTYSTTLALGGEYVSGEKPKQKTTLEFYTEGILGLYVDDVLTANNTTLNNVGSSNITVKLKSGSTPLKIDKVTVTAKATQQDPEDSYKQFYTISGEGIVTLHPAGNIIKGDKPIKVTVEAKDGNKKYTGTVNFNFKQKIESVKVTGEKKGVISQPNGTEKEYALSLNANANIEDLGYKLLYRKGEEYIEFTGATVAIDKTNRKLNVKTYATKTKDEKEYDVLTTEPFFIEFLDGDNKQIGERLKIDPTNTKFSAPTVKTANANDREIILSLALPKNAEGHKNLVYYVEAKASTAGVAEGMKGSEEWYFNTDSAEVKTGAVTLKLANNGITEGNGKEQKYDINVKLVQFKELEPGKDPDSENIVNDTGTVKKLSEKTRKPSYETKMGITKKTTTFTKGQYDILGENGEHFVCVGMAKFSSMTSYTKVDMKNTCVRNADGIAISTLGSLRPVVLGSDNLSLWVDTNRLTPGKATLVVYPEQPANTQCTPATLDLTVKEPIDSITIAPAGDNINLFKQDGKAATIKFTATVLGTGGNKPASNKVKWEIGEEAGEGITAGAVTVNNGTVTVNKDFVLKPDGNDGGQPVYYNWFTVRAVANDYAGNTVASEETKVILTNKKITVSGVKVSYFDKENKKKILNGSMLESGVDPGTINASTIEFIDKDGYEIDQNNLTIKTSPAGLTVNADGSLSVTKAGKFTITATANDGGKSTVKCIINNTGRQIASGKLFILNKAKTDWDEKTDVAPLGSWELAGGYVQFLDNAEDAYDVSELDVKASSGLTLTPGSGEYSKMLFISGIKKEGTYKITASPKDGSKSKKEISVTVKASKESYKVKYIEYFADHDFEKTIDNNVYDAKFTDGNLEKGGKINADNPVAIVLEAARDDSIFSYNATLSVKGGSVTVKRTGNLTGQLEQRGYYVIKPTSKQVELTFKYGKGTAQRTLKYVINVNSGTGEALKVAKGKKTEFYSGVADTITDKFSFSTKLTASSGKEYRLSFAQGDAAYKLDERKPEDLATAANYIALCKLLNEAGKKVTISDGLIETAPAPYGAIATGSYQIYVTLLEVEKDGDTETGTVPLTKPALITFKANAARKPNAKFANGGKVSISDKAGETVDIEFTPDSAFGQILQVILLNNNENGKANNFNELFDTEKMDYSGKSIKLTRSSTAYNGWSEKDIRNGYTTVTGWIKILVKNEDGENTSEYCEKITLTLKKQN